MSSSRGAWAMTYKALFKAEYLNDPVPVHTRYDREARTDQTAHCSSILFLLSPLPPPSFEDHGAARLPCLCFTILTGVSRIQARLFDKDVLLSSLGL